LVKKDKDFSEALGFLASWPDLNRAAALVMERTRELDGDRYEILTPASEALADKHKLAAVLVLRAMIDFALNQNRSSRYKHAARHLLSCASLSARQLAAWSRTTPMWPGCGGSMPTKARSGACWTEGGKLSKGIEMS
jgi:hypothetical protein